MPMITVSSITVLSDFFMGGFLSNKIRIGLGIADFAKLNSCFELRISFRHDIGSTMM